MKKLLSILFALVLLLSFSLVTAVPAAAATPLSLSLQADGDGVAQWSSAHPHTGSSSVKLGDGTQPNTSYGRVNISVSPVDIDDASVNDPSVWAYSSDGSPNLPYINILLDTDGDGTVDDALEGLTSEGMPLPADAWTQISEATGYYDGDNTLGVTGGGFVWKTLAEWKDALDDVDVVGVQVRFGSLDVNNGKIVYVDDIAFAGTTYDLDVLHALADVDEPTNTTAGAAIGPVTVSDQDQFGNFIAGQDITASLLAGTGTLSGTLIQTTDALGIATFDNLSIDLIGADKQLQFTADSETVDSVVFTISHDVAASIVISPDEATIDAGESQEYTAEATDGYGNTFDVTADTAFSIDGGAGGSWLDNVYTSEVAGEWTVAGAYEALTDTATLTVEPGAVNTLTIEVQPSDTVAGVVIAPPVQVKAVDEFGNLIEGLDVTASLEAGTGTLSGTLTQVTDASGIATFDDLSIGIPGSNKQLRFTAADSVTVDSAIFEITPAQEYDELLTLNDGWTLMSTDKWIDADSSAWEGIATLVYKHTGEAFEEATFADLEPVEAIYVKMPGSGWAGLNYLDTYPAPSAKSLVAGWNLVSSATDDDAATVLSPLRYVQIGQQQGVGLTTVVAQGSYNVNGTSFYLPALTDAHWDILAEKTLDPFDGYWVYMTAATSFGVIPQ